MVPGSIAIGFGALASGENSIAIGSNANTNNRSGSIVLSDLALDDCFATANNQISMRFQGGYRFYTNSNSSLGVSLNPNNTA
jgi:hypothetical protein